MDSPGSPLSEHSDDEFPEQEEAYHHTSYMSGGGSPSPTAEPNSARPSKRQKTGPTSHRDTSHAGPAPHSSGGSGGGVMFETLLTAAAPMPEDGDEDISSDTDGSVPGSPHMAAAAVLPGDEDDGGFGHKGEQISFCRWEGCPAGELGNMDLLVQHLHDEHIHARQKKYSCEWADCTRKGIPHASGYALRAHMRSHTREKPFYCTLPECDRSFTRSDALAKHMRTVHETEALRPSDPVPKHHSSNPQNKHQKLRLTFKAIGSNGVTSTSGGGPGSDTGSKSAIGSVPPSPMTGPTHASHVPDEDYENHNVMYTPDANVSGGSLARQFPADVEFTEEELALSPEKLYQVLRMQIKWASEEGEQLRREVLELDERRRREWSAKDLAVENVLEAEAGGIERRSARKSEERPEEERAALKKISDEVVKLDLTEGDTPWWKLPPRQRNGGEPMEGLET